MSRKVIPFLIVACMLFTSCANHGATTATEPEFKSISTDPATTADAELYATLAGIDPTPADRVALAIAIQGLDAATLPITPSAPRHIYKIGDSETFWTHNGDTLEFTQITARLMAISTHAYFWQDVATDPLNGEGQPATSADWDAVGASFDHSYEAVRALFGSEQFPGLDGDPRLFVINSDSLGNVGGYFGQADLLPAVVESHSNQGQYFFMSNTGTAGINSEYYKEVLAHEFQHMVQKNVDANEEGWMNEGLSMLAQQVVGMRGDNWVEEYLKKPDQSLWFWSSKSADYGQSFLYLEYIYEQLGEGFMKALVANHLNGLASIDANTKAFHTSRNADALYVDSMTAAYFNNAKLADGQFVYRTPTIPAMTPRYEFTSLPGVYQGVVQQYGGYDIMSFSGKGNATLTFTGDERTQLIPTDAHSGENFWWSNRYDSTFGTLTRPVDLSAVTSATLNYWAWYDIEEDWDYAYLLVSTDGGAHWDLIPATSSRDTNPNDQNLGHGFTGKSGGGADAVWIQESADLSAYAGKKILLRFAMQNDLSVNNFGFAVDDMAIPEINWSDNVEGAANDWVANGFVRSHNYVPQIWQVRAIELHTDGTITIHDLEIKNGAGRLNINFGGLKKLIVFVFGQTRFTNIPASYQVQVAPAPK